jgi:hypothetical protein
VGWFLLFRWLGTTCIAISRKNDKIAEYDVIADPARLQRLALAVLNDGPAPSTGRLEAP